MPRISGLILCTFAILLLMPDQTASDDTGFASMHDLRKERGKLCMIGHFHHGSSSVQKSKRKAKREAIISWQDFTDFEYGSDWATFSRATEKGISCSRIGGWSCDVQARPCRYKRRKRRARR